MSDGCVLDFRDEDLNFRTTANSIKLTLIISVATVKACKQGGIYKVEDMYLQIISSRGCLTAKQMHFTLHLSIQEVLQMINQEINGSLVPNAGVATYLSS
ncbi:hypothetical protein CEXT_638261 [Caerostris extrusa]|uniref:Uncharacterized protein n=1 Tax=Caerostris extrusa TaxID=172846 RepID=A0AAV4XCX9_CAEEX|nr:hypothetical protein CEXT_638261 [Caerostris extrusa]